MGNDIAALNDAISSAIALSGDFWRLVPTSYDEGRPTVELELQAQLASRSEETRLLVGLVERLQAAGLWAMRLGVTITVRFPALADAGDFAAA